MFHRKAVPKSVIGDLNYGNVREDSVKSRRCLTQAGENDVMRCAIWYHWYQFKKREKHPWGNVTFSCRLKSTILLKVTLLQGCFSRLLNCTNGSKSCNASHIQSNNKNTSALCEFLQSLKKYTSIKSCDML